ncbi:hypothetical protein BC936DRAFT_146413 [Jimgerdemannia flammicorona]|uniref:ATP-dependent rRNA helicase SPB4-like C-terminal tail domain-containing protein n=1 Tax=Jimgerdemannia flammicorona TaxID=994334 RepID=A0A433D7R1_9FUNG|nr:hypothetical protein BC936DRAFT_146413 [Jimgerdemannia flammicorona]
MLAVVNGPVTMWRLTEQYLPKMPELKDYKYEYEAKDVNFDTYKYADKVREKQRMKKLAEEKAKRVKALDGAPPTSAKQKKATHGAWSEKTEAKERKEERRAKKERKREFLRNEKRKAEGKGGGEDEGDRDEEDEWTELQREERLAKKVRTRRMGKEEFEREIEVGSGDDGSDF